MKELDELFDLWENRHLSGNYHHFIRDGIVDESWWLQEQRVPKICFFLKEARTQEKHYDLTDDLRAREPWRLWQRVAIWTQAIQAAFSCERAYDDEKLKLKSHTAIKQISVVNVKKSDGKNTSNDKDLLDFAERDKDLLKQELELINPDIIVCGYTYQFLSMVLDDELEAGKRQDTMYCFWKDKLIIDYYHPACHYPNRVNYYALMSICRMAKQEWEERKIQYAHKADRNIRSE